MLSSVITGEASCEDKVGEVTVVEGRRVDGEREQAASDSSAERNEEEEEVEFIGESLGLRDEISGAVYARRLVVDISSVGAEISDRWIVPAANLGCPSRNGMGAETSGRF